MACAALLLKRFCVIVVNMKEVIDSFLQGKGLMDAEAQLTVPVELDHGDYSTNAALVYAKELSIEPRLLAIEIADRLKEHPDVERVDVAGPGFVNIRLKSVALTRAVATILNQGPDWGKGELWKNKRVLIEKSAPNLFKPFHVGHLLNISIGESLSQLVRSVGAKVTDISDPSDISLGVAKAIWSLTHSNNSVAELNVHDLGKAYVEGTRAYDEDETAKSEIIEINKKLNEKIPSDEYDLYRRGIEINLEYFKRITTRLGSTFEGMFFESESGGIGKQIVESHLNTVFNESQGAIIFKGEDYGLHTRVFVTSRGLPVYEAKDIGLLKLKFDKYNPDLSVVITDVEQRQYFEVIKKAASLIEPTWAERSLYWQHGRLRFQGGKISSRYGNVPLAEDLLEQVKAKVLEVVIQSVHVAETDHATLAEQIALGALKYAFLKPSAGHNIVFDFEHSISLTGDSGPYVQYSYARACSIVRSGADAGLIPTVGSILSENQRIVIRHLVQFPDVITRAVTDFSPHHVAQYIGELASIYNSWYSKEHVLGDAEAEHRLALTQAVAITLRNALGVLGIPAPERM
jgi:arginyl-tRNA synthetase